jgi:hypothetical protein
VRVPMNFTNLQRDIPKPKVDGTEFYTCMVRARGRGGTSNSAGSYLTHSVNERGCSMTGLYNDKDHPCA